MPSQPKPLIPHMKMLTNLVTDSPPPRGGGGGGGKATLHDSSLPFEELQRAQPKFRIQEVALRVPK